MSAYFTSDPGARCWVVRVVGELGVGCRCVTVNNWVDCCFERVYDDCSVLEILLLSTFEVVSITGRVTVLSVLPTFCFPCITNFTDYCVSTGTTRPIDGRFVLEVISFSATITCREFVGSRESERSSLPIVVRPFLIYQPLDVMGVGGRGPVDRSPLKVVEPSTQRVAFSRDWIVEVSVLPSEVAPLVTNAAADLMGSRVRMPID